MGQVPVAVSRVVGEGCASGSKAGRSAAWLGTEKGSRPGHRRLRTARRPGRAPLPCPSTTLHDGRHQPSHSEISTALPATRATTVRGLAADTVPIRATSSRGGEGAAVPSFGEPAGRGARCRVVGRLDRALVGDALGEPLDQRRVVFTGEEVGQVCGGELADELALVESGVAHHHHSHVGRGGQPGRPCRGRTRRRG